MDNFLTNSFQNVLGSKFQNVLHFKDQIPKDLTSGVVYRFDSAMSPIVVNVWDTWMLGLVNILVYHHLPENKLSLRTAP